MSKFVVQATWDDVPHLSDAVRTELLAQIPEYQRDARTRGVPQLGAGVIFPIAETDIAVNDFPIPDHYPRAYGMDVGWNKTAAVWGARDNQAGVIYLYSEYYQGQKEPLLHAEAIRGRGDWIPGAIDPAAAGSSQRDGRKLMDEYRELKLHLSPADNAEEAGLMAVWNLLSTGRLKVFKSLVNWFAELRTFSRDEHGKVKESAKYHLMACTRYFVLSGRDLMRLKPAPKQEDDWERMIQRGARSDTGWMG